MKEVILDIDEWLPQKAIDQTVELICRLEKLSGDNNDINKTHGSTDS